MMGIKRLVHLHGKVFYCVNSDHKQDATSTYMWFTLILPLLRSTCLVNLKEAIRAWRHPYALPLNARKAPVAHSFENSHGLLVNFF